MVTCDIGCRRKMALKMAKNAQMSTLGASFGGTSQHVVSKQAEMKNVRAFPIDIGTQT